VASIQADVMLEHAKYFIKTGPGISKKSYSHLEEAQIDGTGHHVGIQEQYILPPTIQKLSDGTTYHLVNGQASSSIHI
jgi:hypothetical protein